MEKNFWDRTHELSADYQRLADELMPDFGNADTLEGEFIRAISKLGYDFYNNGFCNNTSGPLEFLNAEFPEDISKHVNFLEDYVNTGGYAPRGANADIEKHLTELTEKIVLYVLSKEGNYTESDLDMLDYGDEDYYPEDEEDDDYWGDDEEDEWN